MKQYLTPEQTAKLIELGFEKPKNTQYIQRAKARNLHSPFIEFGEPEFEGSYTIGELIEMLDKVGVTTYIRFGGARAISLSNNKGREMLGGQLIDLLFVMIVELKEEGVI